MANERNGNSNLALLALAIALLSIVYTTIVAVVAIGTTPALARAINRIADAEEKK